ncbi:MAG: 4-hydroxy-2-oxovalerate aldolase [Verrucomicrobiales bacterium]|nr:4-hydroxy-2-oxovalerate aldolase [Verrucomicrobiales bacterium]|tara:strand:+ start:5647 stop:6408 length:762 start_codon:yes stop_codon:yes gene_type:complete
MRQSKTWARIRAGETIRTCVLGHYIPAYVCQAARSGYDCIWIDMEHRAWTIHQIQALLAHGHLYDIDIMLRPPTLEKTGLYRYLEEGAAGLLIPHVSTVELAKQLVQSTKFPPIGNRGIDNAGLDSDYHIHDPDEYVAWANRETFLAIQIETPEAVANVDAIAAIEGVDLIFVGPGDLSLRLRQSPEMTMDEAWEKVAAACKKHGKAFGGPTIPPEEMKKRHAQGAQMLVANGEFENWFTALTRTGKTFDELG